MTLFHIPKLSLNLLSIGQLCELGVDILFTNHVVDVQDPHTSQVLGTGHKVRDMFEAHDLKSPSQVVSSTTLSPNLWQFLSWSYIFISSSIISFSRLFRFNSVSKI